jgi:hypothetical protein
MFFLAVYISFLPILVPQCEKVTKTILQMGSQAMMHPLVNSRMTFQQEIAHPTGIPICSITA